MPTNAKIGKKYSHNRPSNIIFPRAKSLSKQSIKTWKDAYALAQLPEEPNRLPLLQVYESILLDGHLESILESRILKILGSKFKIVNEKEEENPELTKLFKKKWFTQFLKEAMWSKWMGTTVLELWDLNDDMELDRVGTIPRENTIPLKGLIIKEVGDQVGYPYKEGALVNYYIQVGEDTDIGKLSKSAPDALSKRLAKSAWLEYVEKYAIPPRTATTDSSNPQRQKELAEMLAAMVNHHYAVLQGNEKLEMLNVQGSDAHETFDKLMQRMNSEMSKRELGQDGTTDSKDTKGNFGSLKVMQEVADDRHNSDKTDMEYLINDELIWRLQLISGVYSGLQGHRFEWDDSKELTAEELIELISKLGAAGYVVDPKQIEEKTGFKIIGRNSPSAVEDPDEDEKKKPKVDANYREGITALYPDTIDQNVTATASNLEKDILTWARGIYYGSESGGFVAWNIASKIAKELLPSIKTGASIRAMDGSDRFITNLQSNIFVFSTAKTYAQYAEISALLTDENGDQRSFQDFKDEVLKLHEKYNIQYLKTEYNNAVRTAQAAEKWKKFESEKDLFDLQYDTAGDDKVRQHHRELDRITRPVDDAFWDRFYPPIDWSCRCSVRQVGKGTAITPDSVLRGLPKPPKAFQFNPGKQELIFSNDHPYIKNLQTFRKSELDAVKDYGLKEVKAIYAAGKNIANPLTNFTTKEAARNWFDAKATNKVVQFNAKIVPNQSFKVNLTSKTFGELIRDNARKRWEWIGRIPNILSGANEIYLLDYFKNAANAYRYIKYFQDRILIVDVQVKGNDLTIINAFEANRDTVEKVRFGMLLKGK